jgi:putative transposase
MKARQYTEEQIIVVLREGEASAKVADLYRKYGMSDATYYNWKAKYAGRIIKEGLNSKSLAFNFLGKV